MTHNQKDAPDQEAIGDLPGRWQTKIMKIRTTMTSLLILATSAFASDLGTFTSPAGFYQVRHPRDWKITTEGNITNVITPDGEGAITISAYHSVTGDFARLMEIPHNTFAKAEVISPFEPISGEEIGIKGEFRTHEIDGRRRWLVRALHSKRVFVFITANDSDEVFQQRRETYSKIVDSLKIRDPK